MSMSDTRSAKRARVDPARPNLTADVYEAFQQRSCIRSDFSCMYFMLGLVEEASEVLEACRSRATEADVVKECGDVLWYTTGLLRTNAVALSDISGASPSGIKGIPVESEPEVQLVLSAGALAGRLKKFERGDYDKDQFRVFVRELVRKILEAVSAICSLRGRSLSDAVLGNQSKIEKRLESNMIKGDGSNRGEELREHTGS